MNDLDYQISFVCVSVERILAQVDFDPLSPTYGCAHLAYWRDKTSDVADMRRQEAILTLALLYSNEYPGSQWKGEPRLLEAVEALLEFWCDHRYPDGSLDEWYKGERAFAVAAFTVHAVARALIALGEKLDSRLAEKSRAALGETAKWLTGREDLFKTNHQAVGVAALAFAGQLLSDRSLTDNAHVKLDAIINTQTKEGWFPEIGHMDVGYSFLTAEFAAMAMTLWDDFSRVGPFVKAFDFACQWMAPDLSLGDEYGVCHNPYVSRIAPVLLAPYSGYARYMARRFGETSPGFNGLKSTMGDDLRLARWAYQPLLAYGYTKKLTLPDDEPAEAVIPLCDPHAGDALFREAGMARISRRDYSAALAAAAGGLVRLFGRENGAVFSDHGYAIGNDGGYETNITYKRDIEFDLTDGGYEIVSPIFPVAKFMPSFTARVVLRLACSTAMGSRVTRKLIDIIRKRKGTAINQSSANLSASRSGKILRRNVSFGDEAVIIRDHMIFDVPVSVDMIFVLWSENRNPVRRILLTDLVDTGLPAMITEVRLTRRCVAKEGLVPKRIEAHV